MNTQKINKNVKFSNIAVLSVLGTSIRCWYPLVARTTYVDCALERWPRKLNLTETT